MFEWKTWVYYITWGIVILYFLYIVFLKPIIGYKWWRYEVREDEIEIQYGFFIVERTLVPMVRVQHVDTIQGPIMRRYNLASVEVSTAATVHVIPALEYEEAEQIRYYISKMVQTVKEDV